MNPMAMMALMTALGGLSGLGGDKAQKGSSFGENQLGGISDILQQIKGMGGAPDISQDQNFQNGQGWLNDLYNDENFFDKFEAPLMRQFNEETVPGLANRFASMGSGGSTGSTAFRNQLGREGSNLSTNIAALRGGMQQQGVGQSLQYAQQPFQNIMQMYNQALGQPTQNQYTPPNAGFFGNILSGLSGGVAQGMGQGMGQKFAGQYAGTQ
jgi:hypothetical protein